MFPCPMCPSPSSQLRSEARGAVVFVPRRSKKALPHRPLSPIVPSQRAFRIRNGVLKNVSGRESGNARVVGFHATSYSSSNSQSTPTRQCRHFSILSSVGVPAAPRHGKSSRARTPRRVVGRVSLANLERHCMSTDSTEPTG